MCSIRQGELRLLPVHRNKTADAVEGPRASRQPVKDAITPGLRDAVPINHARLWPRGGRRSIGSDRLGLVRRWRNGVLITLRWRWFTPATNYRSEGRAPTYLRRRPSYFSGRGGRRTRVRTADRGSRVRAGGGG